MSPTRTIPAEATGPISLTTKLPVGLIIAQIAAGDRATVTLEPVTPGDAMALDIIERATVQFDAHGMVVTVPDDVFRTAGGLTIMNTGGRGGSISVSTGDINIGGLVIGAMLGGNVHVSGGRIGGDTPGAVRMVASLPLGSRLSSSTLAADLRVTAPLEQVVASSVSGDVVTEETATVHVESTSGRVTIFNGRNVRVTTVSGDIDLSAFAGEATLRSTSGDLSVACINVAEVNARTISGDVRVTGSRVRTEASSVSGRVRVG